MKIGVLTREEWRNTGIETFEKNVVPDLLEGDDFEAINFSMNDSYPLSITVARFKVARKVKKVASNYDKIFVPSQDLVSFNPDDVDAEVIPYVHDILPVTTNFSGWLATPLAKHYTNQIEKLDKVICASKATKSDLEIRTSFNGEVNIVYQGVDFPEVDSNSERTYDLIYVGSLIPRKNPELVKEVFERAIQEGYNVASVNYEPEDLPGDTYTNISDEKLAELYSDSRYYFHPAKAEGFGRGPVEAQANGCIPIGLDTNVNQEVLGKEDVTWIVGSDSDTVLDILEQSKGKGMRENAEKNASKYKWDKTVKEIKRVIFNGEKN